MLLTVSPRLGKRMEEMEGEIEMKPKQGIRDIFYFTVLAIAVLGLIYVAMGVVNQLMVM